MKRELKIMQYKEVLESIKSQEAHLLLWNGFNRGLGINTSYDAIFNKMIKENHWIYKDVKDIVNDCWNDLEKFIWKMTDDVKKDNIFLKKYISNKIKLDFMKAAHEIVKEEIKNIYTEKNQSIYILLKNFENFFTLNYDSFLYLLLLHFKQKDEAKIKTLALQPSLNFQEKDINTTENNIYTEIKQAREKWFLIIWIGQDVETSSSLSQSPKSTFTTAVKEYFKEKGWKWTEIDRVINKIWEEEKENAILEDIDDWYRVQALFPWSKKKEYIFNIDKETQNLFFLHGAFHIYKDGEDIKKITQNNNKALYDRLEEILNDENKDILTIFQADNKLEEIEKNDYLKKCYNKLSALKGILIIIGFSFSDNDKHICDQINKSLVKVLYVSTRKEKFESTFKKLCILFPEKDIILFETESISYDIS